MKKYLLVTVMLLLFVESGKAQSNCSTYYPFEEGTTFQFTMYNPNEKATAVINYEVKEATEDTAVMSYEMLTDNEKLISVSDYTIKCTGDGVSIDFNSLAAPGVMEQYKDMEVDISGTDIVLPNDLTPGQTLPDANVLMNVKMAPINMKMSVNTTNRKVEGKETVTTPAGTYDCMVLTWDHESKIGIKVSGSAKQWLAEGVGMVKQENYNKKGKLTSYMELTAFNN